MHTVYISELVPIFSQLCPVTVYWTLETGHVAMFTQQHGQSLLPLLLPEGDCRPLITTEISGVEGPSGGFRPTYSCCGPLLNPSEDLKGEGGTFFEHQRLAVLELPFTGSSVEICL